MATCARTRKHHKHKEIRSDNEPRWLPRTAKQGGGGGWKGRGSLALQRWSVTPFLLRVLYTKVDVLLSALGQYAVVDLTDCTAGHQQPRPKQTGTNGKQTEGFHPSSLFQGPMQRFIYLSHEDLF